MEEYTEAVIQKETDILKRWISFEENHDYLYELRKTRPWLDWDCENPLVVLTSNDVISILERFLEGKITPMNLHRWASGLDMRETLGIEEKNEDVICDVLSEIGSFRHGQHPEMPLPDKKLVQDFLDELKTAFQ